MGAKGGRAPCAPWTRPWNCVEFVSLEFPVHCFPITEPALLCRRWLSAPAMYLPNLCRFQLITMRQNLCIVRFSCVELTAEMVGELLWFVGLNQRTWSLDSFSTDADVVFCPPPLMQQ